MNQPSETQPLLYEKPLALRLGAPSTGAGPICGTPGSTDTRCTSSGSGAVGDCWAGSDAGNDCSNNGSGAADNCIENGNDAVLASTFSGNGDVAV
jgi:hypothetical protein